MNDTREAVRRYKSEAARLRAKVTRVEALMARSAGSIATPGNFDGEPLRNFVLIDDLRAALDAD